MKYAMAIGTPTTVTPSIILSVIRLDEALNISMPALSSVGATIYGYAAMAWAETAKIANSAVRKNPSLGFCRRAALEAALNDTYARIIAPKHRYFGSA